MNTKTKILDAAESLTQTRGINGFSYLHLADELGIKTSSIHYHFKTKADLARALVVRTSGMLFEHLAEVEEQVETPSERLTVLVDFFADYADNDKFCLCGMMSAELLFVDDATRAQLCRYFAGLRAWVASQFELLGHPHPAERALQFVGLLEGSLLLARLHRQPSLVREALTPLY